MRRFAVLLAAGGLGSGTPRILEVMADVAQGASFPRGGSSW